MSLKQSVKKFINLKKINIMKFANTLQQRFIRFIFFNDKNEIKIFTSSHLQLN